MIKTGLVKFWKIACVGAFLLCVGCIDNQVWRPVDGETDADVGETDVGACVDSSDCSTGSSCAAGQCVSKRCVACTADAECADNQLCMPTLYKNVSNGNYCLDIKNTEVACPIPYLQSPTVQISVDNKTAIVCGPIPDRTTCEAVLANLAGKACENKEECPPGGLCQENVCTYLCRSEAGPAECIGACFIGPTDTDGFGYCK